MMDHADEWSGGGLGDVSDPNGDPNGSESCDKEMTQGHCQPEASPSMETDCSVKTVVCWWCKVYVRRQVYCSECSNYLFLRGGSCGPREPRVIHAVHKDAKRATGAKTACCLVLYEHEVAASGPKRKALARRYVVEASVSAIPHATTPVKTKKTKARFFTKKSPSHTELQPAKLVESTVGKFMQSVDCDWSSIGTLMDDVVPGDALKPTVGDEDDQFGLFDLHDLGTGAPSSDVTPCGNSPFEKGGFEWEEMEQLPGDCCAADGVEQDAYYGLLEVGALDESEMSPKSDASTVPPDGNVALMEAVVDLETPNAQMQGRKRKLSNNMLQSLTGLSKRKNAEITAA